MDRQQNSGKVGKQEVKDRQKYKKALEDIGCILSDVCNDFYADGYEDGENSYGTEIRTKQDVDEAYQRGLEDGKREKERAIEYWQDEGYQRGYEDGKKAVNEQAEKITYADINEAYNRGFEDGRKCKTDDLWKCYKYGVHEERQKGFEKCSDCKYFNSTLTPCNSCKDNSEFEPAEKRQEEFDIQEEFDEKTRSVTYKFVPKEAPTERPCKICKYQDDNQDDGCSRFICAWEQMRKESHD